MTTFIDQKNINKIRLVKQYKRIEYPIEIPFNDVKFLF